jgi:hypothetical protein
MNGSFKIINDGVSLEIKHNNNLNASNHVLYLLGLDEDSQVLEKQVVNSGDSFMAIARLRGSGESDSPAQKYSSVEFANDIRFIFFNLKLNNPIIVMSGLTSVYCLKFLLETGVKVSGLIFLNNGASCIPLNNEWYQEFIQRPNSLLSKAAAKSLVKDSEFINYYPELFKFDNPIYLLRSEQSHLGCPEYDIVDFKRFYKNITVKEMPNSGKYICEDDRLILNESIKEIQNI